MALFFNIITQIVHSPLVSSFKFYLQEKYPTRIYLFLTTAWMFVLSSGSTGAVTSWFVASVWAEYRAKTIYYLILLKHSLYSAVT